MNTQEKLLMEKRLKDYAQLDAAATELTCAIEKLEDKHYTMNSSQVRVVEAITIQFGDTEHRILLGANKIGGWQVARELLSLFKERRDEIWEAMEKI